MQGLMQNQPLLLSSTSPQPSRRIAALHIEAGQPIEADHILGDLLRRDKNGATSSPLLRVAYA